MNLIDFSAKKSKLPVNVVLVNPPLTMFERYGTFAASGTETPPLGLASLAAVSREAGHNTSIIDCPAQNLGIADAVNRIAACNPDLIGFTAVTIAIHNAANLARAVKTRLPKTRLIIGGPHVTSIPEETLNLFPEFDAGVLGEGEVTFLELIDALQTDQPLNGIKGLIFRKNNSLIKTSPREYIKNLDSLPMPAWDLLPDLPATYSTPTHTLGRQPGSSLITSRGCFGKCKFCARHVFGNICRSHSAERIVAMKQHLHKEYGINDIIIYDDTFIINHKRVREVCRLLNENEMDITWGCTARIDVVNPDLLRTMRRAGCVQIGYGIESGNQDILDFISKGTKLRQIRNAVHWTSEAGIHTRGFFIYGLPMETAETMRDTTDFALSLPLDDFQASFFTPLPGTEFYQRADEFGEFTPDWRKINMWRPMFVPHGLTTNQLIAEHRRAFHLFYFRLSSVWNHIKRIKKPKDCLKLFKGLSTLLKTKLGYN